MAAWIYDHLSFSAKQYRLNGSCPTANRHLAGVVTGIVAWFFLYIRVFCWKHLGLRPTTFKWWGSAAFIVQTALAGSLLVLLPYGFRMRVDNHPCWNRDLILLEVSALEHQADEADYLISN
jgi:hypothetical protein